MFLLVKYLNDQENIHSVSVINSTKIRDEQPKRTKRMNRGTNGNAMR